MFTKGRYCRKSYEPKGLSIAPKRVYQNKCVNGIYKKLKNNLVAEPVGPVKNGFLFFTSP
jgi:hypothetical protein